MAKFCTRCGKPLEEGQVCSCSKQTKIDTSSAITRLKLGQAIIGFPGQEPFLFQFKKA